MTVYLALLRGVNVGGKSILKMSDLKDALTAAGYNNVQTYIQSGNVIFSSDVSDKQHLGEQISQVILTVFHLNVDVALFSADEWKLIIKSAPNWWGADPEFKHNLLALTKPLDPAAVVAAIGELKPDIENVEPGNRVVYQSLSWKLFGRTTSGKLASNPIYKQMTIRNYNTATKLLTLLEQAHASQ